MKERRLLTIPQAADEIGMSRVVLWRLVKKGTLPSIEAGRFRLIDASDLAKFQATERRQGWPKGKPRKPAPR
jgi:excisionase family DNA binding protein